MVLGLLSQWPLPDAGGMDAGEANYRCPLNLAVSFLLGSNSVSSVKQIFLKEFWIRGQKFWLPIPALLTGHAATYTSFCLLCLSFSNCKMGTIVISVGYASASENA